MFHVFGIRQTFTTTSIKMLVIFLIICCLALILLSPATRTRAPKSALFYHERHGVLVGTFFFNPLILLVDTHLVFWSSTYQHAGHIAMTSK